MKKKLNEQQKKLVIEAAKKSLHPMAIHVAPTGGKTKDGKLTYKVVAHGSKVHPDFVKGDMHETHLDDLRDGGFKVKQVKGK